jgi:hypothetical protein
MNVRKPSSREQTMLFLLVLTALITGYLVWPFQKHIKTLDHLEARASIASADLESIAIGKVETPDMGSMEARLPALRQEKERLGKRILTLGGDPFRPCEAKRVEDFNLEIASLARMCGVEVIENIPVPESEIKRFDLGQPREYDSKNEAFPSFLLPEDPRDLPLRKITMFTSYAGFRAFIEGFCRLSSRVVIVRFKAANHFPDTAQPMATPFGLRIELTWMIV